MSKPKLLDDCRTARDFFSYAESKGGRIENGGRHTKIVGPGGGRVAIPTHNGDILTGTRRAIVKMLIAVGLGIMPLACILSGWLVR